MKLTLFLLFLALSIGNANSAQHTKQEAKKILNSGDYVRFLDLGAAGAAKKLRSFIVDPRENRIYAHRAIEALTQFPAHSKSVVDGLVDSWSGLIANEEVDRVTSELIEAQLVSAIGARWEFVAEDAKETFVTRAEFLLGDFRRRSTISLGVVEAYTFVVAVSGSLDSRSTLISEILNGTDENRLAVAALNAIDPSALVEIWNRAIETNDYDVLRKILRDRRAPSKLLGQPQYDVDIWNLPQTKPFDDVEKILREFGNHHKYGIRGGRYGLPLGSVSGDIPLGLLDEIERIHWMGERPTAACFTPFGWLVAYSHGMKYTHRGLSKTIQGSEDRLDDILPLYSCDIVKRDRKWQFFFLGKGGKVHYSPTSMNSAYKEDGGFIHASMADYSGFAYVKDFGQGYWISKGQSILRDMLESVPKSQRTFRQIEYYDKKGRLVVFGNNRWATTNADESLDAKLLDYYISKTQIGYVVIDSEDAKNWLILPGKNSSDPFLVAQEDLINFLEIMDVAARQAAMNGILWSLGSVDSSIQFASAQILAGDDEYRTLAYSAFESLMDLDANPNALTYVYLLAERALPEPEVLLALGKLHPTKKRDVRTAENRTGSDPAADLVAYIEAAPDPVTYAWRHLGKRTGHFATDYRAALSTIVGKDHRRIVTLLKIARSSSDKIRREVAKNILSGYGMTDEIWGEVSKSLDEAEYYGSHFELLANERNVVSEPEAVEKALVAVRFAPRKWIIPKLGLVNAAFREASKQVTKPNHVKDEAQRTLELFGLDTLKFFHEHAGHVSFEVSDTIVERNPRYLGLLLTTVEAVPDEKVLWILGLFSQSSDRKILDKGAKIARKALLSSRASHREAAARFYVDHDPASGLAVAIDLLKGRSTPVLTRITCARLIREFEKTDEFRSTFIYSGMFDELDVLKLDRDPPEDGLFASYSIARAGPETFAEIERALELDTKKFISRSNRRMTPEDVEEIKEELRSLLKDYSVKGEQAKTQDS